MGTAKYTKARAVNVRPADPFNEDSLNRRPEVEKIAAFIQGAPGSYVLAIDGPWGTGKTTFLRMLAAYLRNGQKGLSNENLNGALVIEHNAWEKDFSEDPLLALITDIERQLKKDSRFEGVNSVSVSMRRLLKSSVPGAVSAVAKLAGRVAIKQFVSEEALREFKAAMEEVDVDLSEFDADELNDKAAEFLKDKLAKRIKEHEAAFMQAEAFKKRLGEFSLEVWNQSGASGKHYPLVIIVDELDRCRPTYAIEFLERIKHFFDVEHIVFVLGIARAELEHSIRAVYGSGFNSYNYLHRFVDWDYQLVKVSELSRITEKLKTLGIDQTECGQSAEEFTAYAIACKLSSRDIDQVLARYALVYFSNEQLGISKTGILASYLRYLLCAGQANHLIELNSLSSEMNPQELKKYLVQSFRLSSYLEGQNHLPRWYYVVIAGIVSRAMGNASAAEQIQEYKSKWMQVLGQEKILDILTLWHQLDQSFSNSNNFHIASEGIIGLAHNFSLRGAG